MIDLLARIEAALARSEAAAEKLTRRHRALRDAANDALADLDRVIEAGKRKG
ncbi:MAG: hypothetical protein KGZ61_01385 [Sandarakinorhabdus sp.]|nr:hypothetical protein [Sandarakinorhabdus sp.]